MIATPLLFVDLVHEYDRIDDHRNAAKLRTLELSTVPVIPRIHTTLARSIEAAPGRFDMADWYCGTIRCRAGWIVALAQEAGHALERAFLLHSDQPGATGHAAALIYAASDPLLRTIPLWFTDTEDALGDISLAAYIEGQEYPIPHPEPVGQLYDNYGRPLESAGR